MEKKSEGKSILLTIIGVALVVAVISAVSTVLVMKQLIKPTSEKSSDIKGTWYNTYAGETFLLTLKSDNTYEYGYEGSDMTKGTYSNTSDVLSLVGDNGTQKLIFDKGKDYIEIDSSKYYNSKDTAAKNDGYYFVPEDYDTSMFTKITVAEMIEKFNKGDAFFVLTARGSCAYCQQFRPVAAESITKYNYTLYYLDTTTVKKEDYETIRALDSNLEDFGSTPNVYYFKGKTVADKQAGAADAETYGAFLEKNGVKAK